VSFSILIEAAVRCIGLNMTDCERSRFAAEDAAESHFSVQVT